jgi:hypothetical protein
LNARLGASLIIDFNLTFFAANKFVKELKSRPETTKKPVQKRPGCSGTGAFLIYLW